jgi:DNA polymerase IV
MDRHIIHLHIPAFPIAVARVCRPELRGRPVAVAPLHSERALLLSTSIEARKEGVFRGMDLGKAVKFCPDLVVLPPDPDLSARACRAVDKVVSHYTPLWEPSRPGHIYLDVTGTDRLWGKAKDTALHIRQEIRERLNLPGAAGVAANKLVSSIASRVVSSEGVLDVDHGRESSFIGPMKATILPGVTRAHKRILLEELSIALVREVAALDMGSLRLVFGRQALVIHQRALGIDPTPVFPPRRTPVVGEEIAFPRDENDEAKLLGALYTLVERCSAELRRRSLSPRKAGMVFRYADQKEVVCRIPLPPGSRWEFELYPPLERLFVKSCNRRVRIRYMRVWFGRLEPPDPQLSLFQSGTPAAGKKGWVTLALDRIREKHGAEAIGYGKARRLEPPSP